MSIDAHDAEHAAQALRRAEGFSRSFPRLQALDNLRLRPNVSELRALWGDAVGHVKHLIEPVPDENDSPAVRLQLRLNIKQGRIVAEVAKAELTQEAVMAPATGESVLLGVSA